MKRRRTQHVAIPEQSTCRRCINLFVYGRLTKPRFYCDPCVSLEKQDTNDFTNAQARAKRLAARMTAWLAHCEAANA